MQQQQSNSAGEELIIKGVRFLEFFSGVSEYIIRHIFPGPETFKDAEQREEVLALVLQQNAKTTAEMIEELKKYPVALVFQISTLVFMSNLDFCEKAFDGKTTDHAFMAHCTSLAEASPMLAAQAGILKTLTEIGADEDLYRIRRYLKFFIETTVGSDFAAARKLYEDNKETYNKMAETQLSFFEDGSSSGHVGSEGEYSYARGAGEGAEDDGSGGGKETVEEGEGEEVVGNDGEEEEC